jgi:hypothetical protein
MGRLSRVAIPSQKLPAPAPAIASPSQKLPAPAVAQPSKFASQAQKLPAKNVEVASHAPRVAIPAPAVASPSAEERYSAALARFARTPLGSAGEADAALDVALAGVEAGEACNHPDGWRAWAATYGAAWEVASHAPPELPSPRARVASHAPAVAIPAASGGNCVKRNGFPETPDAPPDDDPDRWAAVFAEESAALAFADGG